MPEQAPADLLWLRAGNARLALAPAVGGSIAALYSAPLLGSENVLNPEGAFHWLRPATPEALQARDPLRMGSFPLVPWCNRIRNGQAEVLGHHLLLPDTGGIAHAIHGLGWQAEWTVSSHEAHSAQLEFTYPAGDWPWAFTATQRFTLTEDGLHCALSVRNDGVEPMPAALGHHPYFPHRPGTELRCSVQAMWETDAQRLPLRLAQPDFLPSLQRGVRLDTLDLDNNFTGWDRRFDVEWPVESRSLALEAEAPLDYFVLFCPKGQDHFCAEPVSNCTDWLNWVPHASVGGTVLARHGVLSGGFRLSWREDKTD